MTGTTWLQTPYIQARENAGLGTPFVAGDDIATLMCPPPAVRTAEGALVPGAIAVLTDSAIGYATVHQTGVAGRMVTGHLNIELTAPLPVGDDVELLCRARLLGGDDSYAVGSGEVLDAAGRTVAVATIGAVLFPGDLAGDVVGGGVWERPANGPTPAADVDALLGTEVVDRSASTCTVRFTASDAITNMSGGVHGGMGVLMAERTVDRLLRSDGGEVTHRLVAIRAAYPRGIPADGTQIECVAEAMHRGRRLALARAVVHDQQGRPAVVVDASYVGV